MNLGELITALEAADPNQVVSHGFHNPHSYRGDYYDLAFEPAQNVTVASMLEAARTALGTTYQGWKGGDFTMGADTWCWLSEQGTASCDNISSLLFELMLSQPADEAAAPADRATVYRRSAARQVREWADEAQQPETPAAVVHEDPARIDRMRPEFADHASVESIDVQLRRARSQLRRWHLRVEWLISLRQARVEQKERGEWPAVGAQQPETQAFVCKCPAELCHCGHPTAVSQPGKEA
jgi:hypothetical protein